MSHGWRNRIYRATVQPRLLSTGATATVRMAGGGQGTPYRFGGNDYRAGIAGRPRFSAALDWDANGWTGGVLPSTAIMDWCPSRPVDYAAFANDYLWSDAPITIEYGDEKLDRSEPASWTTLLVGTVEGITAEDGIISFTIADLSAKLNKPVTTATFAGTGGIEGPAEAEGRVKRRNWGNVYNVEGRILDKANAIWEFGDPAYKSTSFDAVRDMGRAAAPAPTVVTWQGSVAATFAALQAASAVQGSCVVAPSIQCVKWWTTPVGPLTADITGELSGTAGAIGQAILASVGGGITISNAEVTALDLLRSGPVGIHIGDDRETISQALDRLYQGVSTVWVADRVGAIKLRPIVFSPSVEAIRSIKVNRKKVFRPHKSRKVGWKKNYRQHNDGEIASSLLVMEYGEVLGDGSNRIRFSRMEAGTVGWIPRLAAGLGGLTAGTSATLGKRRIQRQGTFSLANQNASVCVDYTFEGFTVPVDGGERLYASAFLSIPTLNAGASWTYRVGWLDNTGAIISFSNVATGFGTLSGTQLYSFVTAPAAAVGAFVEVVVNSLGTGNGTAFDIQLYTPMLCGAGDAQVTAYSFNAGPSGEYGADVTAFINVAQPVLIAADSTGTPKADELSRDVALYFQRQGVNQASGVTWSATRISGNATFTISGTGTGQLTITGPTSSALATESVIRVTGTYGGLSKTTDVKINRVDDPPTNTDTSGGGGGGTSGTTATTTTLGSTTGTAYDTTNAVSPTLTAKAGPLGRVTCTFPAGYIRQTPKAIGQTGCFGKWQWRVVGGSFADITTEIADTTDAATDDDGDGFLTNKAGSASFTMQKTGLTAGTSYEFRFLWRRVDVSGSAKNINRSTGTLQAAGS